MSEPTRQEMTEKYKEGYKLLKSVLKEVPKEGWDFRPGESEWTVREIVAHLADAEIHGYIRLRTLLAEPGETVKPYNQNAYSAKLGYSDSDPELALKLYKGLVKGNYALLKRLPETIDENEVTHPEDGQWNIDSWLDSYVSHTRSHIKQIKRNLERMSAKS
ncbi:MAG: DinB family protein [bacterium]|nr:DinB family protein [bacterium]